ncbi:MAG: hypothetical protein HYU54_04945 [Actinobacteria bacterium]|nr:hypothetical protein [Actinomycetota bacterium]
MAIKGKSKARAKRAVTRGPKPAYVPVKKPLLARRGLQIGLAVVVVLGSAAGIWYGVAKERSGKRAEELAARERDAVSEYQVGLDPALNGVGEVVPPTGFRLTPDLEATITSFENGDVSAREAGKTANQVAEAAKTASKAVEAIDVLGLVQDKGFGFNVVNHLLSSKSQIVYGLELHEQAALILAQATEVTGDQRDRLLARATGVAQIATKLFNEGYSSYVDAQIITEIFVPTGLAPAPIP